MKVSLMELTIVIDNCTFTKRIGAEYKVYSEEYGIYIPNSENVNNFESMILICSKWLEKQD